MPFRPPEKSRTRLDAFEIVTGRFVRAVGALSAETLVPGGRRLRGRPRRARLRVPWCYFPDGRDRSVPLPAALGYGHRHSALELALPLSGAPLLVVEGKTYRMRPDDLAVIAPQALHFESTWTPRRPYALAWFVLGAGVSSVHVAEYAPGVGYSARGHAAIGATGPAVGEIERIALGGDRSPERLAALRVELLALASRAARFLASGGPPPGEGASGAVRRARAFIRGHYLERISVADVAGAAHLSPNYLSVLFRESTGRTVLESIHELKLSEAKVRLRETDAPVKEIAYELGFESPHYFSRFFRQATGRSPSAFRTAPGP